MDDANKGVKTEAVAPAAEQVVTDAGATAASEARVKELEAQLAAKTEEARKAAEEKENYKQGLLRAKGKKSAKPVDLSDPVAADEHLNNLVEDKILERKAEDEARSERQELERLRQEKAELQRLLKAAPAATATGGGSGSAPVNDPKPKDPNAYWTEEDKASLRKRGLTDAEIAIAENRARNKDYFSAQESFTKTK